MSGHTSTGIENRDAVIAASSRGFRGDAVTISGGRRRQRFFSERLPPTPTLKQFDRNVAIHESGHATVSRLLGLDVIGCTINFINGHHGLTWGSNDTGGGSPTVADLCAAFTPLMPSVGASRADIADELERASCQVISSLAGPLAEKLFTAGPLPGSEHDFAEAFLIAGLVCRSPRSIDSFLEFARTEARALLLDRRDAVIRSATL
jgi:hypothetical protein